MANTKRQITDKSMKRKDLSKLKEKSQKELIKLASDKKTEILKVIANIAAGREKNLKKASNLKRDHAQILTIIREKELIEKSSTSKKEKSTKGIKGRSVKSVSKSD